MKGMAAVTAMFLSVFAASPSSIRSQGALDRIDVISIEDVFIGDPLPREHDPEKVKWLFANDTKNYQDFKVKLKEAVTARLKGAGLRVDPSSGNGITFSFFGGKFTDSACASTNFYLLDVSVKEADEELGSTIETILGVVSDEELSAELSKAAMSVLDHLLYSRKFHLERETTAP